MLMEIECPACKAIGKFSLADESYKGPYKCWKCMELYTIEIKGDKLLSCEPLTQEELERQQESLTRLSARQDY